MKRYNPCDFKELSNVSMVDIEDFYSTFIVNRKSNVFISIVAPLMVCMALHGEEEKCGYLSHKFPLMDVSGWTPALGEREVACDLCFFYVCDCVHGMESISSWTKLMNVPCALYFSKMLKWGNLNEVAIKLPFWNDELGDIKM